MTDDRFATAGIRQRVLAGWTASPARFREDANAEEDLALGGYRDRLVVELAQNAADAAARAEVPGRLLLSLSTGSGRAEGPVLVAANTGTPLDVAGVQALATLRASAKRDDASTIGRFGVGFAAVLAVTDEPVVMSRAGGVRFSAADTRELVHQAISEGSGVPELADEVQRRDGHVPTLRLPFEAASSVPDGYDTAVVLPLRDSAAVDLVRRLLGEVDDALLLALPALDRVRIEIDGEPARELGDVLTRWRVLHREGDLDPAVLVGRPTEERSRSRWRVTWALPVQTTDPAALLASAAAVVPAVVHAPTPCEELLPWPALLVATLPLEPSRRHVAPGPVTDAVVRAAADAYVDLLTDLTAAGEPAWPLVPTGLPAGAVDGALRAHLAELLPAATVLTAAEDGTPLRPRDAVTIAGVAGGDDATVAALSVRLAGLVLATRPARAVLRQLGVREIELTDVVDALPEDPDPGAYLTLYSALEPLAVDPLVREALAALPVPLAGGGMSRGVRGLVLADATGQDTRGDAAGVADDVGAALARLGARVVHPVASHPLLERLGATRAGPRALLELDVVRAAVEDSADPDGGALHQFGEPRPGEPGIVDAVLTLVRAAVRAEQLAAGDLPWLADLALPDEDGSDTPAGALALPGSPAARWYDPEEIGLVQAELLARWGEDTLACVGVLRGPGLFRAGELAFDPDDDESGSPGELLEGWADYCEYASAQLPQEFGQPRVAEVIAVRDLDAISPDALPEVIAAIAADAVLRPTLTRPVRVLTASQAVDVLPYTAWWLRDRLGQGGVAAGARDGLERLLPAAPDWIAALDPEVQSALGVVTGLEDVDAAVAPAVLDGLTDPELDVPPAVLLGLLRRFALLAAEGVRWPAPPSRVRGLSPEGNRTVVVDADDAVVLESPMYLQRTDLGVGLPVGASGAAALADLFELPLAGELVHDVVTGTGLTQPTPPEVLLLIPEAPETWCEADELAVDGQPVDWWISGGVVHAATVHGLARGLSWAAGRWDLRAAVQQVLADPAAADAVLVDEAFARNG